MEREKILSYLNEDIMNQGTYYSHKCIPAQISHAIYMFGNLTITDILAFIDITQNQDGSQGVIITPTHIYFCFTKSGSFAYEDIQSLRLQKHRHQQAISSICLKEKTYTFQNNYFNQEKWIEFLSFVSQIDYELQMTIHEKIEYYTRKVIDDIFNDEYEDVALTSKQDQQLHDVLDNLKVVSQMEDDDCQSELEIICKQSLDIFFDLELDSDEIDILIDIEKQISSMMESQYGEDIINQYTQGNKELYERVQNTMQALGISEEELKGKTPEELEQYINDLCHRFGISKSMLDDLAKKFTC